MRRFVLHRTKDVSGLSGTGIVGEGVEFPDGSAVFQWVTDWPNSIVFHKDGVRSVLAVHGHAGHTQIIWVEDEEGK